MDYVARSIENQIRKALPQQKVIVIVGSRRVGKTVLLHKILENRKDHVLFNGEDIAVQELLRRRSIQHYKNLLFGKSTLVIDEAQEIPEIGKILKLIRDSIPDLQILVTGSSAFSLQNNLGEPLTGRQMVFTLYPLSEGELNPIEQPTEKYDNLMQRLVFGNYPELLQLPTASQKTNYLRELVNSYLLKDVLAFENIRNSNKILSLLKLIALQIGHEVSLNELGRQLGMSKNTVEKYLDILNKTFILYNVTGFSRNLKKEVTKTSRWYFYDNGIRNTLVANLNLISNRNDKGILWENYMVSERVKYQEYKKVLVNNYFWRTYDQQEIDWVEEREGGLFAYEFKFNPNKVSKIPIAWKNTYTSSSYELINTYNYLDWLS